MTDGEKIALVGGVVVLGLGAIAYGIYRVLSSASDFGKWAQGTAVGQATSSFLAAHVLDSSNGALSVTAQQLKDAGVLDPSIPYAQRAQTYQGLTGVAPKWLPTQDDNASNQQGSNPKAVNPNDSNTAHTTSSDDPAAGVAGSTDATGNLQM